MVKTRIVVGFSRGGYLRVWLEPGEMIADSHIHPSRFQSWYPRLDVWNLKRAHRLYLKAQLNATLKCKENQRYQWVLKSVGTNTTEHEDGSREKGHVLQYLEFRVLNLSSCGGHLVLQEGQLCVCGAAPNTAGTLLQVPQLPLKPVHGTSSQVHLSGDKETFSCNSTFSLQ